jgi:hypothetical protein
MKSKQRFNLWYEPFKTYFNRMLETYKTQIFHKHFNFLYRDKKLKVYNKIPKQRLLKDDSSIIYPQWKYTAEFHTQLKDSVDETKDTITTLTKNLDNIVLSFNWCKNFYNYLSFFHGNDKFIISQTNTNYTKWGKPITVFIEHKHTPNLQPFVIDIWPERYLTHINDKDLIRFYGYQFINSIIKKQKNQEFETYLIFLILQFVV